MFIPIKIKIRSAVLIVVVLFSFFTLFYFPRQEGNHLLKSYESQVENLANSVALGVQIALNEDNYEGVKTAMEYVKGKPGLLFVSLLQTDTVWNDAQTKFTINERVFKSYPDNAHVNAKITSNDSAIVKRSAFKSSLMNGTVLLAFSTHEINENIKQIRTTSLLVGVSILLVGMIISFWLSKSIYKPVEALSKAAKKVGEGDFTQVISNYSNDEIGALTNVFNRMVADISKTREQLNSSNASLSKTNATLNDTVENLKATQAQLIQSEKMASLGELTAGIAHEIQNPLNFINNFSDVNNELIEELKTEREKLSAEEQDALLNDVIQNNEKIIYHGKRADAIVKGMLQHSRQTSGIKELTDLNALCDEYLRLSYHGLRAKDKSFNADVKTDFDTSIGKINVVPQDLGRVILNLVNNAFYAVNERLNNKRSWLNDNYKPAVLIQTKKIDNGVIITIADNGNGIPADILDKIFHPFFTTKPTGQGTGLGLSLAYDIITKVHNGTIKVESKTAEGTKFIITLPV